jgi:hypothetical protein
VKRCFILNGLLLALLAAGLLWVYPLLGQANDAAALKTFLDAHHPTPRQEAAYQFAQAHPEALKVLPCYCGCVRQGHQSNYHCFMKESDKQTPTFDMHGLVCPMCVDIALFAQKMRDKGVPLSDIRRQVDKAFIDKPHLHPTPTPKPAP